MALTHAQLAKKRAKANAKRKGKKYNPPKVYTKREVMSQRVATRSSAPIIADTEVLDLS